MDKFCLTPDHEILTMNGWKSIKDATINDIVATLDPKTNQIEYQNVENIYEFDHKGPMVSIEGREIDTCMTLNHKVYARIGKSSYGLYEAKNIINTKTNWQRWGINTNPDKKTFTIPEKTEGHYKSSRTVDMDDWLNLLGLFITEGYVDQSKMIRIACCKDRVRKLLNTVTYNLGLKTSEYSNDNQQVYITDQLIANYLLQFGHAINKYLPDFVFELSTRQSNILLNALLCGDGTQSNHSISWSFSTSSKRLADDFQRLTINCGCSSKMSLHKLEGEQLKIKGKIAHRNSNSYRISVITNDINLEPSVGGASNPINIINYDGKVHCIEVDNHIFLTRRNGLMYWTGNSARSG